MSRHPGRARRGRWRHRHLGTSRDRWQSPSGHLRGQRSGEPRPRPAIRHAARPRRPDGLIMWGSGGSSGRAEHAPFTPGFVARLGRSPTRCRFRSPDLRASSLLHRRTLTTRSPSGSRRREPVCTTLSGLPSSTSSPSGARNTAIRASCSAADHIAGLNAEHLVGARTAAERCRTDRRRGRDVSRLDAVSVDQTFGGSTED